MLYYVIILFSVSIFISAFAMKQPPYQSNMSSYVPTLKELAAKKVVRDFNPFLDEKNAIAHLRNMRRLIPQDLYAICAQKLAVSAAQALEQIIYRAQLRNKRISATADHLNHGTTAISDYHTQHTPQYIPGLDKVLENVDIFHYIVGSISADNSLYAVDDRHHQTIQIYDATTQKQMGQIHFPHPRTILLGISGDNKVLLIEEWQINGRFEIIGYRIADSKMLYRIPGHYKQLSLNQNYILIKNNLALDYYFALFDTNSACFIYKMTCSVLEHPFLLTANNDHVVEIRYTDKDESVVYCTNIKNNTRKQLGEPHEKKIQKIAGSHDGKRVAILYKENGIFSSDELQIWNIYSKELIQRILLPNNSNLVGFMQDNDHVATFEERFLRTWYIPVGKERAWTRLNKGIRHDRSVIGKSQETYEISSAQLCENDEYIITQPYRNTAPNVYVTHRYLGSHIAFPELVALIILEKNVTDYVETKELKINKHAFAIVKSSQNPLVQKIFKEYQKYKEKIKQVNDGSCKII